MKRLGALSVLFLAYSLHADADIRAEARARIEKLVVEPLQERVVMWLPSRFSRARIESPTLELRLLTSRRETDADGRTFVPFRLDAFEDGEPAPLPAAFAGCYYPGSDAAYLAVGDAEAHVPVDEHPLMTFEAPRPSANESLCHAAE